MKDTFKTNLIFTIFSLPLLLAFQCEDQIDTIKDSVEELNLINIEDNRSTFSVGDYIIINTEISNKQITIDDKEISLSEYLFNKSNPLYYYLILHKLSEDDTYEEVIIGETMEIIGGVNSSETNPYISIINFFDNEKNVFSSKIGIKLMDSGTYLLGGNIINTNSNDGKIVFDLYNGIDREVFFSTSIANSNIDKYYEFAVE